MAQDSRLGYDPTEYASPEEFARSRCEMDREFGMPSTPYTGELGRLVNAEHFRRDAEMNDEFGWGGQTRADLRKRWDL